MSTFNAITWRGALGGCGIGAATAGRDGGRRLSLDGELPGNPPGGQLSEGRTHGFGFIHESGAMGIAFSAFVVVIAALNLVLDFDFIESGAESGAPTYMEWYGAFGLVVTLVWLYLEILRLLAKLNSRD